MSSRSPQDEAYDRLMHLAPSEVQHRLVQVLAQYQDMQAILAQLETLHAGTSGAPHSGHRIKPWKRSHHRSTVWHAWRQYHVTF
jgi:phosphorylase kinase alpha/beta subunit